MKRIRIDRIGGNRNQGDFESLEELQSLLGETTDKKTPFDDILVDAGLLDILRELYVFDNSGRSGPLFGFLRKENDSLHVACGGNRTGEVRIVVNNDSFRNYVESHEPFSAFVKLFPTRTEGNTFITVSDWFGFYERMEYLREKRMGYIEIPFSQGEDEELKVTTMRLTQPSKPTAGGILYRMVEKTFDTSGNKISERIGIFIKRKGDSYIYYPKNILEEKLLEKSPYTPHSNLGYASGTSLSLVALMGGLYLAKNWNNYSRKRKIIQGAGTLFGALLGVASILSQYQLNKSQ
ncbi:MAG: hypothetical protein COY38_05475 [Candidatus Aenigmarchaeota archaeon CG_4_10_14_0_8_um_filter_37_24]|nr:hypothetical protein [Candidatus Aenigmarchaeota archaeon]OIN85956.1 MAG: hypothetical protein AUJ50_04520 [Candidatus Aenigmarchaeota archaeon CG1_02_38_14]PIV68233.1 MAG: hypothetical protein COS07_04645 [Candidatus Aenigmarchaeota archaeon CG01_land_8_20_14_3_00_37_9]PIW41220.1 MAG: hypothetical protein COW21_03050 [Candidatus Aenigmarchaeota archaeon CG15_BIG_FIL_POST_REV_8_21_14_020_37_27]PIX50242.1 MAG: hypothetical protein COZ52_05225 [Candidatus Aenigmarchaeota archaeon CG_4_8_14_3_u